MLLHDLVFLHPQTLWILIPLVAIVGGFITKWHNTNVKLDLARAGNGAVNQEILDALLRLEAGFRTWSGRRLPPRRNGNTRCDRKATASGALGDVAWQIVWMIPWWRSSRLHHQMAQHQRQDRDGGAPVAPTPCRNCGMLVLRLTASCESGTGGDDAEGNRKYAL